MSKTHIEDVIRDAKLYFNTVNPKLLENYLKIAHEVGKRDQIQENLDKMEENEKSNK